MGNVIVCLLPVILIFLSLLEYYLAPNVRTNENPKVYAIVLCAYLAVYLIRFMFAAKNERLFAKMRHKAPIVSAIIIFLTVYDLLTLKSGTLTLPFFPWVNQVLCAFVDDWAYLIECTFATLKLLFTGYFVGAFLGVITGITCGYNKDIYYWISPILKMLGPIPSTTWIPIVLVLAASLFAGSVFVVGLGVWYAVSMATITGIKNVDKSYYDAARTLGAKGWQLLAYVAIPHAVPNIFQGLTSGMSAACVALITAEMIGVESGLGWYIIWQKSWALYAKMYAAIVLICVIFTVVTSLFAVVKRKALRWKEGIIQ